MFKEIKVHATFNERTGYGVHSSRFFPLLDELVRNAKGTGGEVHISLLDTVTASQVTERHPAPSILYNVWESDSQPDAFMDKLKLYDQLWVPSEWQRAASISQGVPEEFVVVVPEGVDPEVYKPAEGSSSNSGDIPDDKSEFRFLHVGQWQPRKSTKEIVEAFLKAFPGKENVRLYLSADTLFPSDTYGSTEERLKAYGLEDPRIIPVHFEERDAYIRRLQSAHVFVSCSRSEGWGLPLCFPSDAKIVMPSGIKSIADIGHDELVFTHTGDYRRVLTKMQRKYSGELVEILIYGDYAPIKCTPEHPILVIRRPNKKYKKSRFTDVDKITPEWIEAKDIKIGDAIVRSVPLGYESEDIVDLSQIDQRLKKDDNYVWYPTGFNSKGEQGKYNRYVSLKSMAFLFGWYIAEGSDNCGAAVEFSLNSKEEPIAQEILRQASLFFNARGSRQIKGNKLILKISSTILSKFFVKYCGKGAENKKIPNELLYGDISNLHDLMVAYSDGDGHKADKRIIISTVSELLSRQIGVALLRMGYKSNIQNCGKRSGNYDQFVITWLLDRKNNIHSNKSWWSRYGIASLVKKITSTPYSGYVYNLEVEKDNSYRLVNASVHNCEAMASGAVTIVADWGGSTEYAGDALLVRVPELIKPFGIYGNWDVPGHWGEPDYNHLVEVMRDAYENYPQHKEKALKTSEVIREKFSWKAAAEKGFKALEDLQKKMQITPTICREQIVPVSEADLRIQARRLGYEITGLKKSSAIFTVDTHPDTEEKLETLKESIGQIKALGYPILVTSHLPLPEEVVESVDFYIYDKKDILSGDDKPSYWRQDGFGKTESTIASKPCHALAAVHNVRNAVDFCRGRYDWIYQMSSDAEVDLREWLDKVHSSDKDMVCIRWEGQPNTVSGQITAARTEAMDKILLRMETWEDFKKVYAEDRFCSERKYFRLIEEHVGLENVEFIDMDVGNRHDQVDWEAWKDDMFTCHFVEGPLLDISGLSKRVYDVVFNDGTRDVYSLKQNAGMWSRPSIKYYKPWTVTASLDGVEKFRHTIDLKGKKVMICMGSKALGDTIAWMPYVEEFRKKHGCKVVCSGWWQEIFDYPEIEFIKPGDAIMDLYASYNVGCFDDQLDQNVVNWRSVPLQKVASDILGLDYKPLKAKLKVRSYENEEFPADWKKPYVCFSEYSTMQNKFWNRPGAWQKVIDRLVEMGYACVSVSAEATQLNNVIKHNGQGIHSTIADIAGAEFYLGLNHGPIWIAYTLGVPAIMISGVSEEWNDFPNPYRIAIDKCKPCFNNVDIKIDRDWNWCPGPDRFVCTREITEERVFEKIDQLRRDLCRQPKSKRSKGGTLSAPPTERKRRGRPRKKQSPKEDSSTPLTTGLSQLGATG